MQREQPTMFVMVGLPGAGKTTRAVEIEAEAPALRLTPDEWLLPLFGGRVVTAERDVIEGRFIWLALCALRCGTHVVLDFGVWSSAERRALRALATSVPAGFELVWLDIDEHAQAERIARRQLDDVAGYELSSEDLARYRGQFEAPTDEELTEDDPGAPPSGYSTWASWAAERWPGLRL